MTASPAKPAGLPLTLGQTLLVTGGNHGDEYEGPLAILDLARRLEGMTLDGRVILLPFMNYPAVKAARRTSPVDGRNMNRIFPGSPTGSLSEKVADFIMRGLLPMADVVLDFHSGGRTVDFLPFAASHVLPDKTQEARCDAAVAAFNAPYSVKMLEIDAVGMFDTAVEEAGKTFVTTELRGGGTATARSVAIARRGIANLLRHMGIVEGAPVLEPSRLLDMPSADCFTFAETDGMLELTADLGEPVRRGAALADRPHRCRTRRASRCHGRAPDRPPFPWPRPGRRLPRRRRHRSCLRPQAAGAKVDTRRRRRMIMRPCSQRGLPTAAIAAILSDHAV